jgi:hyperosmotically inducible periplasmic protein
MKHSDNNRLQVNAIRCAVLVLTVVFLLMINVTARSSDTDDRIEVSVRNSYVFKTYLKGEDIKIKCRDGIVTLTGVVSQESRKTLARETAARLPGVKSVDNRLEVTAAAPTADSDAWIGEKVKLTLLFHRNVSGSKTDVQVNNGIVTLGGEASSQEQKDLTAEYARDIEGVKDVNNMMKITEISTTSKTAMKEDDIDDASITAQVKLALLYHRSTFALNPDVETINGAVTLYGRASDGAVFNLATRLAGDVNGVKSVDNRMAITD